MSNRKRFRAADAQKVADALCAELRPLCRNLIVAGSLRRGKADVGDVEIVYVSEVEQRRAGLFETAAVSLADERLRILLERGVLARRPNVRGVFTWGEKNKLSIHASSGIPVDFFATTERNWWMTVVIRTGPKDLNLRLIESAAKRGLKLHAYGVFEDLEGNAIPVDSEEDVFRLAGLPYIAPEDRQ